MIHNFFDMLQDARSEIVGELVVTLVTTLVSLAFKRFWPQWGKLIKDTLASLLCWRGSRIVALAVVLILVCVAIRPPFPQPHWLFIIHRNGPTEICADGAELSVEPGEPLILDLGTDGGIPVPSGFWSCDWNSLTGQIYNPGNPGNCTDVVYRAPGDNTDIVGLTVNGGSVEFHQLSLSITVK